MLKDLLSAVAASRNGSCFMHDLNCLKRAHWGAGGAMLWGDRIGRGTYVRARGYEVFGWAMFGMAYLEVSEISRVEVGSATKEVGQLAVHVCHGVIDAFSVGSILGHFGAGCVDELAFRDAGWLDGGRVVVCVTSHTHKEEALANKSGYTGGCAPQQ